MGKMSVHGEPKFSEGQPRVFTNQVRVKTLHELHHGPEKVKILVEAMFQTWPSSGAPASKLFERNPSSNGWWLL